MLNCVDIYLFTLQNWIPNKWESVFEWLASFKLRSYKKQETTVNEYRFCLCCFSPRGNPEVVTAHAQQAQPTSPSWVVQNESWRGSSGSAEAPGQQREAVSLEWSWRDSDLAPSSSLMVGNRRCLGDHRTRVTVLSGVPAAVWGSLTHFWQLFWLNSPPRGSAGCFQWPSTFFALLGSSSLTFRLKTSLDLNVRTANF